MRTLFSFLTTLFLISGMAADDTMLRPLPPSVPIDPAKAALGKKLFFDTILSVDDTVSCATCHILPDGGDDNLPVSFGVKGRKGSVNSPTVLNALFNFRQFWDGRAKDLREQAEGPVENPVEMANTFENLVATLKTKPEYRKLFARAYPERGITKFTITDAIAEYEKTLITPNAPIDCYLRGDADALTPQQKAGYELFKSKGCISCHQGRNIGGNMYNKFGIFQDANSTNPGRYTLTHDPRDKYYFKVPSLRNVAETAPYFHDGRTSSLTEAVYFMSEHQLGRKITPQEVERIVAFLHALSGQLPENTESK